MDEVLKLIPQRPPFLFVDRIVSREDKKIITEKLVTGEEDFFKGHFPGNPVMPGVLLSEATFQSAAALMAGRKGDMSGKVAVVTRINGTKFKNLVRPKDLLVIEVELMDELENACFLKGNIKVNGKTVMSNEFAVALVEAK
ncbi:MAG: 3-hydroxyacyl-ACP dehydratase FabZ [Bacteriovoracaceae bacterium]